MVWFREFGSAISSDSDKDITITAYKIIQHRRSTEVKILYKGLIPNNVKLFMNKFISNVIGRKITFDDSPYHSYDECEVSYTATNLFPREDFYNEIGNVKYNKHIDKEDIEKIIKESFRKTIN